MSDSAERQLIDLVSREQRGLRQILIAGITTLVLVVMMSAGLGVYYYVVADDLSVKSERLTADSDRLEKHAFTMRRDIDAQNNRVAAQEAAIRRAYDEMRQMYAGSAGGQARDKVLPAVMGYLERGRHSLADERLIEIQSARPGNDAEGALLKGAAGLLAWERSGAQIKKGDTGLPDQLKSAQDSFNTALADPALRRPGSPGSASSTRHHHVRATHWLTARRWRRWSARSAATMNLVSSRFTGAPNAIANWAGRGKR